MADDSSTIRRLFPLISESPALQHVLSTSEPPSQLYALISAKQWSAAVERCRTHPNEVSSQLRDDRGYTPLHSLLAYNRTTVGEELIPLVDAILEAAEKIDFGAEFPLCSREEKEPKYCTSRKTGGSLRLLLDQNNRARWSPLHLICVQGGFMRGKVDLLKALLQDKKNSSQQQLLSLLDRQQRNVLHLLLEIKVPSEDSFRTVHYVVKKNYQLLFQRDVRGKAPLDYALERHQRNYAITTRRHDQDTEIQNNDKGKERTFLMLKVLIGYISRGEDVVTGNEDVTNDDIIPQNVFHAVCSLSRSACPVDLFPWLLSKDITDIANFKKEVDENGNTTLHKFLANESYSCTKETPEAVKSQSAFRHILASNRDAIYARNNFGHFPLRVAMYAGRREVLSDLIMLNHQAVLVDKRLDNPKLMLHVLGFIALSDAKYPNTKPIIVDHVIKPIDTMFELLRAKPDIVSFGGSRFEERLDQMDREGRKHDTTDRKGWRKKLNSFRFFNRESKDT